MYKIVGLLGATLLLGACMNTTVKNATTAFNHPESGMLYSFAPVGTKTFEIKGTIIVKSRVDIDINGDKNGSEITYEMLIREALKLGADDVMNVRIDKQENTTDKDYYNVSPTTEEETFSHRQYIKKSYIYTATALAVKYVDITCKEAEKNAALNAAPLAAAEAPKNEAVTVQTVAAEQPKAPKNNKKRSLFRK